MYLSHLLIDVGENPDRPRPGRNWIRNRYHVHQRLCMGFPSTERKNTDSHFLSPYYPVDFPEDRRKADEPRKEGEPKYVHTPRDENMNFLYRIDPHPGGSVSILVLSAIKPDWNYAFRNADFLLKCKAPEPRLFNPQLVAGTSYRFLLEVNPTRKLSKKSTGSDGELIDPKWIGKRVPVLHGNLHQWLASKGEKAGFEIQKLIDPVTGYTQFSKKPSKDRKARLFSVRFAGQLKVVDPVYLQNAIISGIGSAKAFGFGLLSLAKIS